MWTGGRSVASNGYVLIRVGKDHPLADVRGYAYEHRLIAFAKVGRLLKPGEHVHHVDGNKQNNAWDNVEVLTVWEHMASHRTGTGKQLRSPGEPNPLVKCACGCGVEFDLYDGAGRRRVYVAGHNSRLSSAKSRLIELLAQGSFGRSELASRLGMKPETVSSYLGHMAKSGLVTRDGSGKWGLSGSSNED